MDESQHSTKDTVLNIEQESVKVERKQDRTGEPYFNFTVRINKMDGESWLTFATRVGAHSKGIERELNAY